MKKAISPNYTTWQLFKRVKALNSIWAQKKDILYMGLQESFAVYSRIPHFQNFENLHTNNKNDIPLRLITLFISMDTINFGGRMLMPPPKGKSKKIFIKYEPVSSYFWTKFHP